MNKNSRNTIWAIVVVVILGLSLWGIKLLPDKKSDDHSTEPENIFLINKNVEDISEITVDNEYGKYNISKNKSGVLQIQEFTKYAIRQNAYDTIANVAAKFSVDQIISDNSQNTNQYGLDHPVSSITVKFNDNSSTEFLIGNQAPSDLGYYVKEKSSPKVYLAQESNIEPFLHSKLEYVSLAVLESQNEKEPLQGLKQIELSGGNRSESIIITPNPLDKDHPSYKIIQPEEKNLDQEKGMGIIESLGNIYAQKIEILDATPDDIKNCNLDNPFATLTMNFQGKDPVVIWAAQIPNTEDYYIMRKGIDIIYRGSKSILPWVEASYDDMASRIVCAPTLESLKSILISYNGKRYQFDISSDGKGILAKYGSNVLKLDDFKKYFSLLSDASIDEFIHNTSENKSASLLSVEYIYKELNLPSNKVDFIQDEIDVRSVVALLDGNVLGKIKKSYIDSMILATDQLSQGKSIAVSW